MMKILGLKLKPEVHTSGKILNIDLISNCKFIKHEGNDYIIGSLPNLEFWFSLDNRENLNDYLQDLDNFYTFDENLSIISQYPIAILEYGKVYYSKDYIEPYVKINLRDLVTSDEIKDMYDDIHFNYEYNLTEEIHIGLIQKDCTSGEFFSMTRPYSELESWIESTVEEDSVDPEFFNEMLTFARDLGFFDLASDSCINKLVDLCSRFIYVDSTVLESIQKNKNVL